ncbi:hypothetical protein SZ54_1312 [Rhizobium sp. UR51a]|nr:hypothetical protein SZ54_1312 [Rhizobium sp. UR51a]
MPVGWITIFICWGRGRWPCFALFSRYPVLHGCLRALGTHLSASSLYKRAE